MTTPRTAVVAVVAAWLALAAAPAPAADPPLPTPIGLVSDFASVLDAATRAALTARLTELKEKTGAEIAVVTVRTTAPDTAFDYAMRLAEAWKPGAPGKDNGVVFLVAVDDRAMFVATGYGIEGALPDGLVGEIRDREILPRFRQGDFPGGIRAGVERMAAVIAREYGATLSGSPVAAPPARRQPDLSPLALLVILLVVFAVLPALFSGFSGGRRRRVFWGGPGPMWGGGFGGGGFGGPGGGFGGFGGGSFGGGGAGGKW